MTLMGAMPLVPEAADDELEIEDSHLGHTCGVAGNTIPCPMSVPKTCGNSAKAHAGCVPKTRVLTQPRVAPQIDGFPPARL